MNCQFANMRGSYFLVVVCEIALCDMSRLFCETAFGSVVFCFMNERLLLRHLVDTCFYQSAQSAGGRWVNKILQTIYV